MIVPYQWILNVVDEEPKTIASKMILFRGERVFRVGLKNCAPSPILFFLAADLNRLGMRVEDVMYGIEDADTCPGEMTQMMKQSTGNDGSLQLFTIHLDEMVTGQRTFVFRICIKGSAPEFAYRLSDRLGKDQLWAAKENLNFSDVEFIVKDNKKLLANKSILAARSPVFAEEFMKKQLDIPHQIRIDGVEPSTVEHFLHFIYTGEPMSSTSLADQQLLKLAVQYQLTTLTSLCKVALKKIETKQMENFMFCFNTKAEIPPTSQISPEKDTEIFFDRTTPTFRCADFQCAGILLYDCNAGKSISLMQHQNEDIFVAYVTGSGYCRRSTFESYTKPVIHLSCARHRSFGLKIEDIYCGMQREAYKYMPYNQFKMESKILQNNAELLQRFTIRLEQEISYNCTSKFNFDIKVVSTIGNYYYEMMDDDWLKDLWASATDQKLTDVDIFVGTVKVMGAHRVILSARSPVLNIFLNKVSSDTTNSIVYFREEFDVDTVTLFLQFLYTGSLETSASKDTDYKQLLELATMYEVETLKNCCQVANAVPPDVEDLTSSLLEL